MIDVEITDTLNGGDAILKGNDLSMVTGWGNMVYLGLFGGNPEQSTPEIRNPNEQDFSYWANDLLWSETPELQFNSETENVLNNVTLSSGDRVKIQQAAERDLSFMSEFAEITVTVILEGVNRVQITVLVEQPEQLAEQLFTYIWDGTLKRLIS